MNRVKLNRRELLKAVCIAGETVQVELYDHKAYRGENEYAAGEQRVRLYLSGRPKPELRSGFYLGVWQPRCRLLKLKHGFSTPGRKPSAIEERPVSPQHTGGSQGPPAADLSVHRPATGKAEPKTASRQWAPERLHAPQMGRHPEHPEIVRRLLARISEEFRSRSGKGT